MPPITLDPWQSVLTVIAAGVAAYFGAYLGEKARNRAIREDLKTVLLATEELKARVSGGLWVDQERWKLKRDVYLPLLQHHRSIAVRLGECLFKERPFEHYSEYRAFRQQEDLRSEYVRAKAAAPAVLSPAMLVELQELEKELREVETDRKLWGWEGRDRSEQAVVQMFTFSMKLVEDNIERFAEAAGEDLGAFAPEDKVAFEKRMKEHRRFRSILADIREERDLPEDDRAFMREQLAGWNPPPALPEAESESPAPPKRPDPGTE